jgi:hypothetical protein
VFRLLLSHSARKDLTFICSIETPIAKYKPEERTLTMETKLNLSQLSLNSTMRQQQPRKVGNHNNNQHHKHNRLQNSMRVLMKQATDFQQQQQQKSNSNGTGTGSKSNNEFRPDNNNNISNNNNNNNNSSVVSVVVDHHPFKQAGVVLQQQIRGLRRRVKSVRALQTNNDVEYIDNSECENSEKDILPVRVSILSPASNNYDDDDGEGETLNVSKLTPKKNSNVSPIPKNTIKLQLQKQDKHSNNYRTPESLPEAMFVWVDSCHHLLTGPDMNRFLCCTGSLSYHCTALCIKTVTLPLTLPVHVGCMTVQGISSIANGVIRRSLSVLADTVPLLHQSSGQISEEEKHQDRGIFSGISGVLSIPGTILCITGKIAIAVVAPVFVGKNDDSQQSAGASSSPEKEKAVYYAKTPSKYPVGYDVTSRDYLDRLRLDYVPERVVEPDTLPCRKLFAEDTKHSNANPVVNVEQSMYLLRVNDWGLSRPTDECDLYYIDISPSAIKLTSHQELITLALDRFVQRGLSLLHNHPICQIVNCTIEQNLSHVIQWHPEGSTKRTLRELGQAKLSTNTNPFKDDILIWSGRFQHEIANAYGRKHGFFLARGCIPMSPYNFTKLLWDNTRTAEYNNFCLGRSTLYGLSASINDDDQSFLNGTSQTASKVIQSEMRVPFAGITVKAICIMHVRPLPTNDGYIICSRSLDVGPAGIQTTSSILQNDGSQIISPAKNEILWGINIIRSMPNYTDGTELTSLSQVGSAVPSFLAQKIGLMGIGDFFKNVRQVAESTGTQPIST